MNECGKVVCVLNEAWPDDQRSLIKRSGVNKNTICGLWNNKIQRVDLDVLARLCFATGKLPGDLLKYKSPFPFDRRRDATIAIKFFKGFIPDETLESVIACKFNVPIETARILVSNVIEE